MKILLYSSILCPYCFAAKNLLKKLNLKFEEVLVDNDSKIKNKMIQLSHGRTSVPQIFLEKTILVVMMILKDIITKEN